MFIGATRARSSRLGRWVISRCRSARTSASGVGVLDEGAQVVTQEGEDEYREPPQNQVPPPAKEPAEQGDQPKVPAGEHGQVATRVTRDLGRRRRGARETRRSQVDVGRRARQAGDGGEIRHELGESGLVEASVLVTVGIGLARQVLMVLEVVAVVDPGDRADRRQDRQVAKTVIGLEIVEQAPVQTVVADDVERVVAIADDRDRERHRPPGPDRGGAQPGAGDHQPAQHGVGDRPPRPQAG